MLGALDTIQLTIDAILELSRIGPYSERTCNNVNAHLAYNLHYICYRISEIKVHLLIVHLSIKARSEYGPLRSSISLDFTNKLLAATNNIEAIREL